MTYRYLMNLIERMSEEQKEQDVTIYIDNLDEFYKSYHLLHSQADDVLDRGHPYLTIHFEDIKYMKK